MQRSVIYLYRVYAPFPKAAAGYLSFFFLAAELLLELAFELDSLPLFGGANICGAISSGKSFHWGPRGLLGSVMVPLGGKLSTAAVALGGGGARAVCGGC